MTGHTAASSAAGRYLPISLLAAALAVICADALAQTGTIRIDPFPSPRQLAEAARPVTGEQVVERVAPPVMTLYDG